MTAAMSAHAAPAAGRPTLVIRGTPYPVLLPKLSDPRLHLAAVITSLQVLGQVEFHFRVSIAQILISLATCAVLEVGIAIRRQRVILWPASALLTGNGVAFILRVPGTPHGDWWSTRGWWIFAATAAVSLLSKYVIVWRGGHVFNPSNIGLVLCFLILGRNRAEPLDFWWGPMSWWLALATAIIVAGGLVILSRLRLLVIAVGFWLSFAAGIAILAASGHAMTARWHLGPLSGFHLWSILVTSPEILVFLFFMITDPKTAPAGRRQRLAYGVGVGLLSALLIAPVRTEYATKVAVLGSLAIVCAAVPLLRLLPLRRRFARSGLVLAGAAALAVYVGVLLTVTLPARSTAATGPAVSASGLPPITIEPSRGVNSQLDRPTARRITRDLLNGLPSAPNVDRVRLWLEPGDGQAPPIAVAEVSGVRLGKTETIDLTTNGRHWTISPAGGTPLPTAPEAAPPLRGYKLTDVARQTGLDFRQGAFRFGIVSSDTPAMMGAGLCWLDYDTDGWIDLFVVNSYTDDQLPNWEAHGGLPRTQLFHNVHGHFVNVTAAAGAGLQVRGEGCVAGDLDGDGRPDIYVTTATNDVLLWNNGNGTFTEGARKAGVVSFGWHAGAAIADVNGDGRPDLFVAGYTNMLRPIASSVEGFPGNHEGWRDLLFLNEGNRKFREVGVAAGLDKPPYDHSLGASFSDFNGDGRLDLYVANDEDSNRLYLNEPGGPLGFRFVDDARAAQVADGNAGMGIANADYNGDGKPDLFVTNSRKQTHAVYESGKRTLFENARGSFKSVLGTFYAGWGDSWIDLNNDGKLDLVLANGAIPVANLAKDASPIRVVAQRARGRFVEAGVVPPISVNGRGLAAADYDNDGRVDVAVNSIGGRLVLLRNTGPVAHWLEVRVAPFSPGAVVTVVPREGRKLVEQVQAGGSYLSSEDPRVHFGLGPESTPVSVLVRWPDGSRTRLAHVRVNRVLTVTRGS
jgi:Na+-translocating ferredoxin:NAD+ oxidoreductase RnfD subunit